MYMNGRGIMMTIKTKIEIVIKLRDTMMRIKVTSFLPDYTARSNQPAITCVTNKQIFAFKNLSTKYTIQY